MRWTTSSRSIYFLKLRKAKKASPLVQPQILSLFFCVATISGSHLHQCEEIKLSRRKARLLIKIEWLILVFSDQHSVVDSPAGRFGLVLFNNFFMRCRL